LTKFAPVLQATCHPLLSSVRLSGNGAVEVQALLPRPALAYLREHRIQVRNDTGSIPAKFSHWLVSLS